MRMIGSKEIGGGFVRRSFVANGKRLAVGTRLTPEQIDGFTNGRRLIDVGFIADFPPAPADLSASAQRFVIHKGGGQYDVIVGDKINDRPLSKDEAEDLATRPS